VQIVPGLCQHARGDRAAGGARDHVELSEHAEFVQPPQHARVEHHGAVAAAGQTQPDTVPLHGTNLRRADTAAYRRSTASTCRVPGCYCSAAAMASARSSTRCALVTCRFSIIWPSTVATP